MKIWGGFMFFVCLVCDWGFLFLDYTVWLELIILSVLDRGV